MPRDCVMTTGLRWPMEAAGSVENATAFPSAPWKSLRDSHSSHRPGYEGIESKALNCPPNRGNSRSAPGQGQELESRLTCFLPFLGCLEIKFELRH